MVTWRQDAAVQLLGSGECAWPRRRRTWARQATAGNLKARHVSRCDVVLRVHSSGHSGVLVREEAWSEDEEPALHPRNEEVSGWEVGVDTPRAHELARVAARADVEMGHLTQNDAPSSSLRVRISCAFTNLAEVARGGDSTGEYPQPSAVVGLPQVPFGRVHVVADGCLCGVVLPDWQGTVEIGDVVEQRARPSGREGGHSLRLAPRVADEILLRLEQSVLAECLIVLVAKREDGVILQQRALVRVGDGRVGETREEEDVALVGHIENRDVARPQAAAIVASTGGVEGDADLLAHMIRVGPVVHNAMTVVDPPDARVAGSVFWACRVRHIDHLQAAGLAR